MELPVAVIILAAGSSSRLGRPKQLLPYRGTTLLRHAVQTALAADLGPVIVVLGAAEDTCRSALAGMPATITANADWEEGMGGSIAAGMAVVADSDFRSALLMLCDQPAITPDMLRALDDYQHKIGASIVASKFEGTLGPPVIFAASHFTQLRELRGQQGARSLFKNDPAGPATVDCPEATWDIDTEEDARMLHAQ